jgi:hypothetical protein
VETGRADPARTRPTRGMTCPVSRAKEGRCERTKEETAWKRRKIWAMSLIRRSKRTWSGSCRWDIPRPGGESSDRASGQSINRLPAGAGGTDAGRSCDPRWKTWASSQTTRRCAPMVASFLPHGSPDAKSRGASDIARTIRYPGEYRSP